MGESRLGKGCDISGVGSRTVENLECLESESKREKNTCGEKRKN